MTQAEKAKRYDEALEKARLFYKRWDGISASDSNLVIAEVKEIFPELKESEEEQNILFEELKAIHLRMEHQTICNDAGGNRMWRRAWQHVNEAIDIIKEDKEAFKW